MPELHFLSFMTVLRRASSQHPHLELRARAQHTPGERAQGQQQLLRQPELLPAQRAGQE